MKFPRIAPPRLSMRCLAGVAAYLLAFSATCLSPSTVAAAGKPPVIISPATATAVVNQSFNYQIVLANFDTGAYSADGLAQGLMLDPHSGAISGAPTQVGTYPVKLTAINANGSSTSTLTLSVLPDMPPQITSATSATVLKGIRFTYQITATNNPTDYQTDGLPDGLSLDSATGLISGTTTVTGAYPLVLSAKNIQGSDTITLNLNIVPEIPVVTLRADVPTANPRQGKVGRMTLTRTGNDLSLPLTVIVVAKGSAKNGVDYKFVSLSKTIPAGKANKRIHFNAYDANATSPENKKTAKLVLQRSDAYTIGDAAVAKVKISYD